MKKLKLLSCTALVSTVSTLAAYPALAQVDASTPAAQQPSAANAATDTEAPATVETINVSASRIQIAGYDQPTPVTVVGAAELQRDARVDVADVIRQLPSFGASSSPGNSRESSNITAGTSALNEVSLRNLGPKRTLVLFDGQRVVSTNVRGGVDFSTIPSSLVERIDVVTGGASAAWGSDAVAGVVNVIVNKKFQGLSVNLEQGDTFSNERRVRRGEVSFGSDFAGDRGHVILSAGIVDSPETFFSNQVEGYKSQRLVNNPDPTGPRLIHADYVGLVGATPGGIITSGPLSGIYFTGQNATPGVFNYGNISDGFYTNGGTRNDSQGDLSYQTSPYRSTTGYGLFTFKVSDALRASVQLNYGKYTALANSYSDVQYGNLTISTDNPYIPTSIRDQLLALGQTSFGFGSLMEYNGNLGSIQNEADSLGIPVFQFERNLRRGVFTLDGNIGENWAWNAYYQQSEAKSFVNSLNNIQNARLRRAVDAVTVTAANVGTSSLPLGSIVCRSTLTDPTNGCAPINLFGIGNASPESIQYISEVARTGGNRQDDKLTQDVGAASMQGTLPWAIGAADRISTAFGAEYRVEEGRIVASPASQASTFQLGNPKNFHGKYNVKEGFLEFNVPILKDQGVKSLSADVAGRYTDYSTSGSVETYKFGLVSQITDDIRFRGSYSRDIRAPNLLELFNAGTPITGTATDPRTGHAVSVFNVTEGNLNLKPEDAKTKSFGFVLTPQFIQGMNLSVDYYKIDITGAIAQFGSGTILQQCAQGVQLFCDALVFGGPGGALSEIHVVPLNSDTASISGLDVAGDYRFPFLAGALDFNMVASYVFQQTQTTLGETVDFAGAISYDSPYDGAPKFRGQLAVTYAQGGLLATAQVRSVGEAHLVTSWQNGIDVDNNDIAAAYYLDLRGSYKWDNGLQLYGAIDNATGRAPPVVAQSAAGSSGYESPFKDTYYDAFGRVYRIGIRLKL